LHLSDKSLTVGKMAAGKLVAVTFAVAVGLASAGAHEGTGKNGCNRGTKPKADLTSLLCTTAGTSSTECQGNCCETDTEVCGGQSTTTCASADEFWDMSKHAKATTSATKQTDCCTAKATCTAAACGTGWALKATPPKCSEATCTIASSQSVCCDPVRCDTATVACGADKFLDVQNKGTQSLAVGAASSVKISTCCSAKAICSSTACLPGSLLKNLTGLVPPANTCAGATCATTDSANCCVADTTKCAGQASNVCNIAGTFSDPAKKLATIGSTNANETCCTAQQTCQASVCVAQYALKAKSNIANLKCAGAACVAPTSMTSQGDALACCDVDPLKCAGATVACGAGKFKDATKNAATAGTTDAAKIAACCSDKTTCEAFKTANANKGSTSGVQNTKTAHVAFLLTAVVGIAFMK